MNSNLYTLEQSLSYRVKEQQRLAEQFRRVSEAKSKQKNIRLNNQLNRTTHKANPLSALSR